MPIYVYEVILADGEEGQLFEVCQSMSEPPLAKHPVTGQPVRRVIQPPHLPKRWTDRHAKRQLSNENLAKHGLTRYEKAGDGTYVKSAGKGPDSISSDSDQ